LIGGGLLAAAMIPNGWQPVLAAVAVGKRVVPIAMRRGFVAVGGSGRSGRVRH
jgi:hypothetical protein